MNTDYRKGWNDALEEAVAVFETMAQVHACGALWMGPQRQRYEGARPVGVQADAMNGPAIAYDGEMAHVASMRSLMKKGTLA